MVKIVYFQVVLLKYNATSKCSMNGLHGSFNPTLHPVYVCYVPGVLPVSHLPTGADSLRPTPMLKAFVDHLANRSCNSY